MTALAHAGHWIGQLLYLVPVLAMVVAVALGKLRERRRRGETPAPDLQRSE